MITLYGMGSPNVLKVVLMLEEIGLPYRFQRCDMILGEQHDAPFRALNPNGKVPVLVEDGPESERTVMSESGAILIYLAEKAGRLLPAAGPARGAVLQWLMVQMSGIGPTFGHAIHLSSFAKDEHYARARFVGELYRLVDMLDARLADIAHLAGDDYSIADIAVFPWIGTIARFFPETEARISLQRWRARIAERPAALRMATIGAQLAAQDRQSFAAATPEQLDRYFGRTGRER